MHPTDIQQIGDELAIKWDDGTESFVPVKALRQHCPCAGCKGEMDIFGKLYKGPEQQLSPRSFLLTRIENVGGYGIQPFWADGHNSGIFPFSLLRRIADEQQSSNKS